MTCLVNSLWQVSFFTKSRNRLEGPMTQKPFDITRRDFLQVTAGGLLLSTLSAQTAWAVAHDDFTFTSDELSLSLHFPVGGVAQLRSLRNPKTGFEWARD